MFPKITLGPLQAALIGAACGALLCVLPFLQMFLSKVETQRVENSRLILKEGEFADVRLFREGDFRSYFLFPAMGGALAGVAIGCALWTTLTKRRVHPGCLVLSWWLLGGIAGFLLGGGVVALLFPRNNVGSTGVSIGFLLPLPLLAIAGSVVGVVVGFRKARMRKAAKSHLP
jgi:hypothetical protein